jgi:hypothetical protein
MVQLTLSELAVIYLCLGPSIGAVLALRAWSAWHGARAVRRTAIGRQFVAKPDDSKALTWFELALIFLVSSVPLLNLHFFYLMLRLLHSRVRRHSKETK